MASADEIITATTAGGSTVLEGRGTHIMVTNLDGAGYVGLGTATVGTIIAEGVKGLAKSAGARQFIPVGPNRSAAGVAQATVYWKASADSVIGLELVTLSP